MTSPPMHEQLSRGLAMRSLRSGLRILIMTAVALFVSAGTPSYWQGWVYLTLQATSFAITDTYLLRNNRELLRRRLILMEQGERDPRQRLLFALVRPLMLATLVVAGLDHRFGWSAVPSALVLAAGAAFMVATFMVLGALRVNSFASSVVEVTPDQRVVTIGPYRWVRHPMYAGMLLGTVATPLVLGSYWAELFLPPVGGLLLLRMLAEEQTLARDLAGYAAYMQQTRSRLVPGLW